MGERDAGDTGSDARKKIGQRPVWKYTGSIYCLGVKGGRASLLFGGSGSHDSRGFPSYLAKYKVGQK